MKLGIIGGSGLYSVQEIRIEKVHDIDTPFGKPSAPIQEGTCEGIHVFFLARHGEGHTIAPYEINYKANIYALKMLGVTHILSISAVGSLREDYAPRDVVIIDQYFDRTRQTDQQTFFGHGIVAHIQFAKPICPELSSLAAAAAHLAVAELELGHKPKVHEGATYVNMQGPAFSTIAESRIYQSWGLDVIGMTNLCEAKLAREAEICYSTVAMVTDYDCWRKNESEHVTINMVVENLRANVELSRKIIVNVARSFHILKRKCACPHALDTAIITDPAKIRPEIREKLKYILAGHL